MIALSAAAPSRFATDAVVPEEFVQAQKYWSSHIANEDNKELQKETEVADWRYGTATAHNMVKAEDIGDTDAVKDAKVVDVDEAIHIKKQQKEAVTLKHSKEEKIKAK